MPLVPEAKDTNLEKSLVAWNQATLVTVAGLPVFYDQDPPRDRPNEWVHVDFLLGMRREFGRQISRTQWGSQVHSLLQLSLCKKRPTGTTVTFRHSMAGMKDAVMAYFQVPQDIPVRDYDAVGVPVIGIMSVSTPPTSVDTDDGYTSGVIVTVVSVPLTYVEAYTLV